jgi:hypothetical protein
VLDRAAAYQRAALTYVDFVPVPNPPGGDSNDVFVTKPARNLTAGRQHHPLHVRAHERWRAHHVPHDHRSPAAPVLSPATWSR